MPLKQDVLDELNGWATGRKTEQAAAPGPPPSWAPVTSADVDATLAKCSTDELARIVETAGPVPMVEWRQLTAEQRRALRASNLLARRQRVAAKTAQTNANAAEQQAVERRQQREAQAAAEREPFLERKREEYQRGW